MLKQTSVYAGALKRAAGNMLDPRELTGTFGTSLEKDGKEEGGAPGTLTAASQISEPKSEVFYALIRPSISHTQKKKTKKHASTLVFKRLKREYL